MYEMLYIRHEYIYTFKRRNVIMIDTTFKLYYKGENGKFQVWNGDEFEKKDNCTLGKNKEAITLEQLKALVNSSLNTSAYTIDGDSGKEDLKKAVDSCKSDSAYKETINSLIKIAEALKNEKDIGEPNQAEKMSWNIMDTGEDNETETKQISIHLNASEAVARMTDDVNKAQNKVLQEKANKRVDVNRNLLCVASTVGLLFCDQKYNLTKTFLFPTMSSNISSQLGVGLLAENIEKFIPEKNTSNVLASLVVAALLFNICSSLYQTFCTQYKEDENWFKTRERFLKDVTKITVPTLLIAMLNWKRAMPWQVNVGAVIILAGLLDISSGKENGKEEGKHINTNILDKVASFLTSLGTGLFSKWGELSVDSMCKTLKGTVSIPNNCIRLFMYQIQNVENGEVVDRIIGRS